MFLFCVFLVPFLKIQVHGTLTHGLSPWQCIIVKAGDTTLGVVPIPPPESPPGCGSEMKDGDRRPLFTPEKGAQTLQRQLQLLLPHSLFSLAEPTEVAVTCFAE